MKSQFFEFSEKFDRDTKSQNLQSWQKMAQKALNGKELNSLIKSNEEAISLGPLFFNRVNSAPVFKNNTPKTTNNAWHISSFIDVSDVKQANMAMLDELSGGANALYLQFDAQGKNGIAIHGVHDFPILFDNIISDFIIIALAPKSSFYASALLSSYFKNNNLLDKSNVYLGIDVDSADSRQAISAVKWTIKNAPHWKACTLNGLKIYDAGANNVQELAAILAMAVDIVEVLKQEGLSLAEIFSQMEITLATPPNTHLAICKTRAMRALWARLGEIYGVVSNADIHTITASRYLSLQDPWSNILRLGVAGFGAILGGADRLTITPFTQAQKGQATEFARRISRNLQHLMMSESMIGQVGDTGFGSFTHENISNDMAKKAWEIFQTIEAGGGWQKYKNKFAKTIIKTNKERIAKMVRGEEKILGVNQFVRHDIKQAKTDKRSVIDLAKYHMLDKLDSDDFAMLIKQAINGYCLPTLIDKELFKPINLEKDYLEDKS